MCIIEYDYKKLQTTGVPDGIHPSSDGVWDGRLDVLGVVTEVLGADLILVTGVIGNGAILGAAVGCVSVVKSVVGVETGTF